MLRLPGPAKLSTLYLVNQPAHQNLPAGHDGLTADTVHPGSTLMSSPSVTCCAVLCKGGQHTAQ